MAEQLQRTPLHDLHRALGGKMVPFAGYEMPVQYAAGIMAEHLHTRTQAGLFDVSHMGQARLAGGGAAAALEKLVPGDIQVLKPGRMRYTLLTNERGGILDDLMVTNAGDHLFLVVNASRKEEDFAHLKRNGVAIEPLPDRALLALQGPQAAVVLGALAPEAAAMPFMTGREAAVEGANCFITRSGYTGEDGFEISVPEDAAERVAKRLLADERVRPVGLGARDSLRLEAGLCLYGNDIGEDTTVIEADLAWTWNKRRREEGGFPGFDVLKRQLVAGPARRRVGIQPEGRAPAREHTPVTSADGTPIGEVTSGGFAPTAGGPVAMGYVASAQAAPATPVQLVVRGTPRPARIVPMPFVPHRYHRG